jgi:hypothetical protein
MVLQFLDRWALERSTAGTNEYLSFNYRGAGNATTVMEMCELMQKFAPTIFCIFKTQVHKRKSEELHQTSGFDNAFSVSSNGRSGCM